MTSEEINFCIIGRVDNATTFREIIDLLDNLPNVTPRFKRLSESWFYVTQDRKVAARAGLLRKNKGGAPDE